MRMRKQKHFDERFERVRSYLIESPSDKPGQIPTQFAKPNHPLRLEIGCGRGKFMTELAENNPDINFIGIEKISNVLLLALEKANRLALSNLRYFNCNANLLADIFTPGQVDAIYLNFSDPWPKKGYVKNRLTHRNFLALYQKILRPGGHIYQKTDNAALFDFSLEELAACGFQIISHTRDLGADENGNIMTEYEARFREDGIPIHYLDAIWPGTREDES